MSRATESTFAITDTQRREFDLRDAVDIWYRRRFMVLSIIILTLVGTEFGNWVVYPVHESKVKILIEGPAGLEVPFSRDNLVFKKSEITQTQSEMLIAKPNLEEVVRSLQLDERPKHGDGLRDTIHALKDRVIDYVRDTKQSVKKFVVVTLGGEYKPPRKPTDFDLAVAHLQSSANLSVDPMSNTDIIIASVRDRDPEFAAGIANALADAFSTREFNARVASARGVRDSIGNRLSVVEPQLRDARNAIALFKAEHGIVDIDGQIDAALEKLALLELTYWDLSQKESVRELSTWEAMRRQATALQDISVREKTAIITKLSELAELESTYQPDHPKVLAARAAVDQVLRRLDRDSSTVPPGKQQTSAPGTDTESLREAILDDIKNTRRDLSELSALDTRYQALVWDQDHTGEVYKFLIRKREDASIAEYTTQAQARIVEPATADLKPIRPRKWLNRGLAVLMSIAVAVGLCAVLEFLDRTVRTPESVARLVGLKTLGSIPYVSR